MLHNTANQPSKFRIKKNWVEINDDSRGTYNTNTQIKVNVSMLKSSLCDYNDAYICVKGIITVPNTSAAAAAAAAAANNTKKIVLFKNFIPFTDCISEINNTQVDDAKNINVVIPVYTLIE